MKVFRCQSCGQLVYFENTQCVRCGAALGFLAEPRELLALEAAGAELWRPVGQAESGPLRYCGNARHGACNWLIPESYQQELCLSCRLNRTIPDLSDAEQLGRWQEIERAKRRVVYGLLRFGLTPKSKHADADGVAFDFLADPASRSGEGPSVMTGHEDGVITLSTEEADPAERERRRTQLVEPYRTLVGHLRHEIGHYYWMRFFPGGEGLGEFRAVFGDESASYAEAVDRHYREGPPEDWRERYVSAYASVHPWEDWAETWAHYLHLVDTLETADAFGVSVLDVDGTEARSFDPYDEADFERSVAHWFPLTYAVNSLNRSMGQPDLYPFVLRDAAIEKLRFVHRTIRAYRAA